MTLLELYKFLQEAGIPVWHYEAQQEDKPYIVYQEVATRDDYASGQPIRESTKVEIVHFTDREFDPSLEWLKEALRWHKIPFTVAHGFDTENKNIISQFEVTIYKDLEDNHERK